MSDIAGASPPVEIEVTVQLAMYRQMDGMRLFEKRAYDLFMENLVNPLSRPHRRDNPQEHG